MMPPVSESCWACNRYCADFEGTDCACGCEKQIHRRHCSMTIRCDGCLRPMAPEHGAMYEGAPHCPECVAVGKAERALEEESLLAVQR